jgi:hypothetical protein
LTQRRDAGASSATSGARTRVSNSRTRRMVSLSAGVCFHLQSIEELDAMLTRGRRHPFRPSGSDPHPFSEVAAFKIGTVAAIKPEMGPPSVGIYTADQRRRSSPAGWGGSSSHRSSSSSPVFRGLATKPWRRVATTPLQEAQLKLAGRDAEPKSVGSVQRIRRPT